METLSYVNALLQAVARQRDSALNAAAQVEAHLELARVEIAELKARVEALKPEDEALKPEEAN